MKTAATLRGFALVGIIVIAVLAAASAQQRVPQWQLTAGGSAKFDVASVKPNKSDNPGRTNFPIGNGDVILPVGGLFSVTNIPLRDIVAFAYKLTIPQTHALMFGLPNWIDSERFDIEAKADGNPTKDQFWLMVQSLLGDRFKLAMHHENRKVPVYAVVLADRGRLGSLLKRHEDDSLCLQPSRDPIAPPDGLNGTLPPLPCGGIAGYGTMPSVPGQLSMGARKVTMDLLAVEVPEFDDTLNRLVINKTGLDGTFDLMVQWSPRAAMPNFQPDPNGPSFLEAVRKQLGLKLVPQTDTIDAMVVDHIEQPTPN